MITPLRVRTRLLASLVATTDGCLVSSYSTGSHGYSQIGFHEGGRRTMALGHRVAWEAVHGLIPEGLTIDHLCRNRPCCNVAHMRLMTNVDNARLNGNAIKTHCKRGHPFDEINTRRDRKGHRRCLACQHERDVA